MELIIPEALKATLEDTTLWEGLPKNMGVIDEEVMSEKLEGIRRRN